MIIVTLILVQQDPPMKNNNPKATIQGIKVDKDLLLIEEYKLDT
jgi:hypothetical protein